MMSSTAKRFAVLGCLVLVVSAPALSEDVASSRSARSAALSNDTIGFRGYAPSPQAVMVPASYDLSIAGDFSLGGFVFKDGYPFIHTEGGSGNRNTAIGLGALESVLPTYPGSITGQLNTAVGFSAMANTTDGDRNTAIGSNALFSNTTGFYNTGVGVGALEDNDDGDFNTALGALALPNNTSGGNNIAIGFRAMDDSVTGSHNVVIGNNALDGSTVGEKNLAIGTEALTAATGSRNIALGHGVGDTLTTGTDNILIGSSTSSGGDTNTIRIGSGTGTGEWQQDMTFISGIRGAFGMTFDEPVCTNPSDQLGPCPDPSSGRFKEEVREMGESSSGLLALRPVTFRYKEEYAGGAPRILKYGLIAEEVAEVFPEFVFRDDEGRPRSVRYDALTPLLLNELQKQSAVIDELRARLHSLEGER